MSPESRKGHPTCTLIVSHTGRPPSLSAAILSFIAAPLSSVPLVVTILLLFLYLCPCCSNVLWQKKREQIAYKSTFLNCHKWLAAVSWLLLELRAWLLGKWMLVWCLRAGEMACHCFYGRLLTWRSNAAVVVLTFQKILTIFYSSRSHLCYPGIR